MADKQNKAVGGPEKALVGDEAVQSVKHEVKPEVVDEVSERKHAPEATQQVEYTVSEFTVAMDTVVTDPTSPEAVQIPDAGRGDTTLPIHTLSGPTPEDVFSEKASKSQGEISDEDHVEAARSGKSADYSK